MLNVTMTGQIKVNVYEFTLFNISKDTYTLKRISNWPLYKIWYYATYLIDASKVWLLCIVHAIISINGKKKPIFMYKIVHAERWVRT